MQTMAISEKKVQELEERLQKNTHLVNYKNKIIQNNLAKISQKEGQIEVLQEEIEKLNKKCEDEEADGEYLKSNYL